MTDSDFLEFATYLTGTAEVFDAQLSKVKIDFYFNALKDLTIAEINTAINHIVRTSRFFPKPAEIREAVYGKPEDRAVIAVDKIQNALRGVGGYQTICFDDPIIHLIIQNYGGWVKLSDITQDEWKWLKKEFIKHYQVYASRGVSLTPIPQTLSGIHEKVNTANGLSWPQENTVMIGDGQAALGWTEDAKSADASPVDKVQKLTAWVLNKEKGN